MILSIRFLRCCLGLWASVAAGQTLIDLKTQSKSVDFSGAAITKPFKAGTALPVSCGIGESYFLTNAPAGKNLFLCTSLNTWSLASGTGTPDPANSANQILSTDGNQVFWRPLGGDASGAPASLHVTGLQGRPVSSGTPVDGQVLRWNNSASDWEPSTATIVTNYSKSFSNSVSVTIAGSEHNLGTANLIVNCYNSSSPAALLQPGSVTVDPVSFSVNVTFGSAQSGKCVVNGAGGLGFAPAAGGDASGLLSNVTVTGLQGRQISSGIPTDGQVLTWSQTNSQWQPQQPAAGAGGGGSQLNVLGVSFGNAQTLTIAAGCTSSSPCNVKFGNTVYSFASSSTVTLSSGTGTAYIYVTSSGTLTVGSSLGLSCTAGCTAVGGISSFPANVVPLFTWSATPLGWDPNGGQDFRAYLSVKTLAAGTGVVLFESGTQTTVSVDAAVVPTYLTGSSSLSFGSVAAGACAAELTIGLSGANVGDTVAPGWPASLPSSVLGMMRVSSANSVSVKVCNLGASAATVPQATFQATIVRSL